MCVTTYVEYNYICMELFFVPSVVKSAQSFNSFAILEAISLNPMEVPDILLNRTPFNDSLGNLHTSISH